MKKLNKAWRRKSNDEIQADLPKWISARDFLVLYFNVIKAKEHKNVGFEHAEMSYEYFENRLNRGMAFKRSMLESCLWSANLLDELGEFWHPNGVKFDVFVKAMLRGENFDKQYNLILETAGKKRPVKPDSVFDYVDDFGAD